MKKYLEAYTPALGELWLMMLVVLCIGGGIIGGIIAAAIQALIQQEPLQKSLSLSLSYLGTFSIVIPFIYFRAQTAYKHRLLYHEAFPKQTPSGFGALTPWIVFPLLLVLTPAVQIVTEPLMAWMPMPDFMKDLFATLTDSGWGSLLAVVILAPLLEEWLCRGIALKSLLQNNYSPAAAIAWSACMFGVIHMNPWQAIPAFILGCVFGWVYWRTRCLWTTIFMHAVNNGLAFLLTILLPDISVDATLKDMVSAKEYMLLYILAVLVVCGIFYFLHRKLAPAAPLFTKPIVEPTDSSVV